MLCFAGLVDVPYSPELLLILVAELLLLAFTLTAFGVMASARIQAVQSFMALMQMFIMPLFFLSGAMFPLTDLPTWLKILTRIDPLTYAIDPMRRAIFDHLDANGSSEVALNAGVTWGSWLVPTWLELVMVAAMGLAMLLVAIAAFNKTE